MSRQLKMADIQAIQALHRAGHSQREIARLTGVHRETVSRYVSEDEANPAKASTPVAVSHRLKLFAQVLPRSRLASND